MAFAVVSILYGVVAGIFLSVAGFAVGLVALAIAAAVLLAQTETGWSVLVMTLAVIVFGQIGYFTTVYFRASALARKRANDARGPSDALPMRRKPARFAEQPTVDD